MIPWAAHLKHAHTKCVAKNFVCVGVVAVSDVRGCNEEREGVLVLSIKEPTLCHLLNLLHALLLVAAHNAQLGVACLGGTASLEKCA